MSYNFDAAHGQNDVLTPTGKVVLLEVAYGAAEKSGVSILITAAGLSLLAVLGLLVVLGVSTYRSLRNPNDHPFMRTHVAAYFVSLLLSDVISTSGSLMNAQWINDSGVHLGALCTAQGALKNAGNVGTAMWSLVIAIHTFCLLFLKWRSNDYVLYATLFVVWTFIGLVVIIGPAAVQTLSDKGPYFGVSGYWCWMTDGYAMQRITLEYLWMFLSAFVSLVLYSLVFLSLRGNLIKSGGKLRLRWRRSSPTWEARTGRASPDVQGTNIAKHMLAYPIAYTALILPIAICRFLSWSGFQVPFEVTIFADTVFMLSGFVNVILFMSTRNIIPARGISLFSRHSRSISDVESQRKLVTAQVTPFVVTEKISVSPTRAESQMAAFPVHVPVPAMTDPRTGKRVPPKRSDSHSHSARFDSVSTPRPPQPLKKTIRQSVITPLKVVKKASLRRNGPSPTRPQPAMLRPHAPTSPQDDRSDEAALRDSWSAESSSRYSASSYNSTAPLRELSSVPATPRHHSKYPSSSGRYGAHGAPF